MVEWYTRGRAERRRGLVTRDRVAHQVVHVAGSRAEQCLASSVQCLSLVSDSGARDLTQREPKPVMTVMMVRHTISTSRWSEQYLT